MAKVPDLDIPDFPKKLFYKINEVASIAGVEAYVLRYWETKFPTLAPEKDENDQRRYRQKDIELVFYIKHLLYGEKYTIAGAVEVLKQEKSGKRKRGSKKTKAGGASRAGAKAAGVVDEEEADAAAAAGLEALREVHKHVSAIRKDVHTLLADLKKWRAAQR
jgi:DNA-binding transcriptional MerR regulator